jgi:c-di-GMP-binding flagellar brake protein YcgR
VQRREHERFRLWFPVQLEAGGQVRTAMNHNIGAGGMLMVLAGGLQVGEPVKVTFRIPPDNEERQLDAVVLRIEDNTEDPEGAWPLRVALVFDDVAPELAPLLETAATRFSS